MSLSSRDTKRVWPSSLTQAPQSRGSSDCTVSASMSTSDSKAQETAFVGWRDIVRELKQERVVEGLKRDMVIGKAKATLMALMGMQDGLVLPIAVVGGRDKTRVEAGASGGGYAVGDGDW